MSSLCSTLRTKPGTRQVPAGAVYCCPHCSFLLVTVHVLHDFTESSADLCKTRTVPLSILLKEAKAQRGEVTHLGLHSK